jgi:hypothetical protein
MKYFAPICVVFACFTAPQGDLGIWVMKSQVVSVQHPVDCAKGAHTKIITLAGNVCVVETPQQVLKTLDDLKDD